MSAIQIIYLLVLTPFQPVEKLPNDSKGKTIEIIRIIGIYHIDKKRFEIV